MMVSIQIFSNGVPLSYCDMSDVGMMNGNAIVVGRKLSNQAATRDQPPPQIENGGSSFNLKDRESGSRKGGNSIKVLLLVRSS